MGVNAQAVARIIQAHNVQLSIGFCHKIWIFLSMVTRSDEIRYNLSCDAQQLQSNWIACQICLDIHETVVIVLCFLVSSQNGRHRWLFQFQQTFRTIWNSCRICGRSNRIRKTRSKKINLARQQWDDVCAKTHYWESITNAEVVWR